MNYIKISNFLKRANIKSRMISINFIILTIISSFSEIFSLVLIIPIIDVIIDQNSSLAFFGSILDFFERSFDIKGKDQLILILISFFLLLNLIKFIVSIFTAYYINKTKANISINLRKFLLSKYLNERYITYGRLKYTDRIKYLNSELDHVVSLFVSSLEYIAEILLLILSGFFLISVFGKTAIYVASIIPLIIIFHSKILSKFFYKLGSERIKLESNIFSKLNQVFLSIKEIKVSNKQKKYFDIIFRDYKNLTTKILKSEFFSAIPRLFLQLFFAVIISLLIIFLIYMEYDLAIIMPSVAGAVLIILRMLPSLNRLISLSQKKSFDLSAFELVGDEYLDSNINIEATETKNDKIENFNNKIKINNISFKYKDGEKNIFDDFSFEIKKGEIIGIKGASGAGKTTLIDIIMGLIQPDTGSVFLDNENIEDIDKRSYLNLFSYVSQNFYIFNDTIKNNIILEDDQKEFNLTNYNNSIRVSQLKNLNNELNFSKTILGDEGIKLSGGQYQRIAIARAFYKDPKIIILDEPTNMLDQNNSDLFFEELIKNKGKKTIIIISHDINLINKCDTKINLN